MAKVLIATLYKAEPVLLFLTRIGFERVILLIDEKPNEEQLNSLKLIKESIGRVVDIKEVKCAVYDIVKVAEKAVEIIDMQPREDQIYINITSGRKTKAIGLLFASYARKDRISKIAYNPEEDKNSIVYLPKLSFQLNESQKKILEYLDKEDFQKLSFANMAEKIGISRAMFYKSIEELKDMDFIYSTDEGIFLTDAGKIARL
ncbi:MAG: CRISPR-associated CARF protein Csa3 [Candidatus Woesearchaeota archaeon]